MPVIYIRTIHDLAVRDTQILFSKDSLPLDVVLVHVQDRIGHFYPHDSGRQNADFMSFRL